MSSMYPYYHSAFYSQAYSPPPYYYGQYSAPIRFIPYIKSRQFPTVNPDIFMHSAQHMQTLMKDASLILAKMANSHQLAFDLMTAAQSSNKAKVNEMLRETGIQSSPSVSYSPDGLKLDFKTAVDHVDCCHLNLSLKWM